MGKRVLIRAGLGLVIVLFASLGTARAHQVWSERQAHSSLLTAESATSAALRNAAELGLLSSELQPFRHAVAALLRMPAPEANPLWDSQRTSFYQTQERAFRRVIRHVDRATRRVTATTRTKAAVEVASIQERIVSAQSLGVGTHGFAVARRQLLARFARATTPLEFRSLSLGAAIVSRMLTTELRDRRRYIDALVRSSGGSLSGVEQRSDTEVAGMRDDLSLLALFTRRASSETLSLTHLDDAVHLQATPFGAALRETAVHSEVLAIQADFVRTIPAKVIVVSTEQQSARLYQSGQQVYSTAVTTGGPELPTDPGIFQIYFKTTPFVFHSPWPPSSPYYYPPTPITFWMPFDGAEGLHDASWRTDFGPGSNLAPTDLGTGRTILGTHGCVNLPFDAAQFVWNWAPVGTTVVVV